MKGFLKVLFLLFLLALLAAVLIYQHGSKDLQRQCLEYLARAGMGDMVETLTGRKTAKGPQDEIMSKSENFYMWKDENGNENFVDSMEQVPPQYRKTVQKISSEKIGGSLALMSREEEGKMLKNIEKRPPPEHLKMADHKIFIYSYEGNTELGETKAYFDLYNMPYTVLDVVKNPEYASQLKMKLGLDLNQKYQLNLPIVEIDGQMIERIIDATDKKGKVTKTSLNRAKINKIFGLRSSYE